MATPTTTPKLIRDQWISVITSLSPTTQAATTFRLAVGDVPFRVWSEENPQACFRRFDIEDRTDRVDPSLAVSNKDIELAPMSAELVVAYPHAMSKYGTNGYRDLRDMMRADGDRIRNAIGINGGANYVSGQCLCSASYGYERGDKASYLVMELEAEYYFDVSTA